MQRETNPLLSGVVLDIGVSGIVSHLWNGGLQSLAIEFLKPHKNSKTCHSHADKVEDKKPGLTCVRIIFYIPTL